MGDELKLTRDFRERLLPFQPLAIYYAARNGRCFITDEPGLGKTIEALGAVEDRGAFPCVVVCKKTARGHWLKHIADWLPHRIDQISVMTWPELSAAGDRGPLPTGHRSVIFDESHMAKNKSERSKAARRLAANVPVRYCLSGTPIVLGPKDLIGQLNLLDRLDDFGGWQPFVTRYCAAFRSQIPMRGGGSKPVWDINGASNTEEMWQVLRRRCLIGRRKADVLPELPAKRHETVEVELTNEADYAQAEADVSAWLGLKHRSEAEALVRLSVLRGLAGRGKATEVAEWVKDFCEDAPNEKVVVFTHHVGVLVDISTKIQTPDNRGRPPTVSLLYGDMSEAEREESLAKFRGPQGRVLVATIETGGESIDLTCASTVAIVEFPWTYASFKQAEDRCHRVGQKNAVIVYSFAARGTIDDYMVKLIEQRRRISDADGGASRDDFILPLIQQLTETVPIGTEMAIR
jgi:SNF2 family DNA or RNA helicase